MPCPRWCGSGALACYVVFLKALNVISHLGYETYPPWVGRWFITSTHHNLHHTRGRGHFMLYFNIWDRLMGTNADDYEALLEETRQRARQARENRRSVSGLPEAAASFRLP